MLMLYLFFYMVGRPCASVGERFCGLDMSKGIGERDILNIYFFFLKMKLIFAFKSHFGIQKEDIKNICPV